MIPVTSLLEHQKLNKVVFERDAGVGLGHPVPRISIKILLDSAQAVNGLCVQGHFASMKDGMSQVRRNVEYC